MLISPLMIRAVAAGSLATVWLLIHLCHSTIHHSIFVRYRRHLLFLVLFFPSVIFAQSYPSEDCIGAIPVCKKEYSRDTSPIGFGGKDEVSGTINCVPGEKSSVWYIFTVNKTGQFGFLLTPHDPADDFDWSLFNLTNADCADILTDESLVVSCNAAGGPGCTGQTGATGDTEYILQGVNCDNDPPDVVLGKTPFNDLIDVEEGNTYVLLINNFNSTGGGYTIDFGLSTDIGIFDETPPSLESASLPDPCQTDEISIEFSEFIQCSTLSASHFQLSGPGEPYSLSLSSVNCDEGGIFSRAYNLLVSPPISADAQYTLSLNVNGTTDALDLCDNPASSTSFSIQGAGNEAALDLGRDTVLCSGETLVLDAGQVDGTYVWSDGSTDSQLFVQSPGTYSVIVTTNCGTLEDEIVVGLANDPITLSLPDTALCAGSTVILNATIPNGSYLWQDGSTGPTLAVMQAGTYTVTVDNGCESITESVEVTEKSGQLPALDLGSDTTLCRGESLLLQLNYPDAAYLWQDGSAGSSYLVEQSGAYHVEVSNSCGAVSDTLLVTFAEGITINLGADTILCPGQTLLLDASHPNADYYRWQNKAEGATFQASEPGTYSVTLGNDCEEIMASINIAGCTQCNVYVPNAVSPNGDGINDEFKVYTSTECQVSDYTLRIFNRWGVLVFETSDPEAAWDLRKNGQKVNQGIFIWYLVITTVENGMPRQMNIRGDLTIL